MLPVKKIYIDSRFKTDDSASHTDFKYDLGTTFNMPEGTNYYVDDVNIPNSWYSIEAGINNRMYVRYLLTGDLGWRDMLITLQSEIYNGDSFIAAIQTELNNEAPNIFKVEYDTNRNRMIISTDQTVTFMIFSDIDLRDASLNWGQYFNVGVGEFEQSTLSFDRNNLRTFNEVIRNYKANQSYGYNKDYYSGYLDFLRYNNIYMSSAIGEYQTLGPRGQTTIIRKIPVTAGSGFVFNDRVVGKHDILSCSKACLRTLQFRFHDAWGHTLNLNGGHVSFSLLFTSIVEDR